MLGIIGRGKQLKGARGQAPEMEQEIKVRDLRTAPATVQNRDRGPAHRMQPVRGMETVVIQGEEAGATDS